MVRSDEMAIAASAPPTTRLTPKRSMSAAANGAPRPKQSRLSETASPIVSWLHANSSCNGISRTPVTERNPEEMTSARNATAATFHA
jgi:hypothetical protein